MQLNLTTTTTSRKEDLDLESHFQITNPACCGLLFPNTAPRAAATATADSAEPLLLQANSKTQWVPLSFR